MFSKLESEKEIKILYRKLALRLHPDYGGSNELMSLLTEAYENRIDYVINKYQTFEEYCEKNDIKFNENDDVETYEKTHEKIKKHDKRAKIIIEMLDFLKNNQKIKLEFVMSVSQFFNEKGYITSKQYNTLVDIYYQFEMHKKQE